MCCKFILRFPFTFFKQELFDNFDDMDEDDGSVSCDDDSSGSEHNQKRKKQRKGRGD